MTTVRINSNFPDAAGSVAVASGVHQVDPVVLLGVAPAVGVGPHVTVLHHVRHLEVGGDLVHAVLCWSARVALRNVVLS